jgi:hypothetical protein
MDGQGQGLSRQKVKVLSVAVVKYCLGQVCVSSTDRLGPKGSGEGVRPARTHGEGQGGAGRQVGPGETKTEGLETDLRQTEGLDSVRLKGLITHCIAVPRLRFPHIQVVR